MRYAMFLILLSTALLALPAASRDQLWSAFLATGSAPSTAGTPTIDAGCILDPDGKPGCGQGS